MKDTEWMASASELDELHRQAVLWLVQETGIEPVVRAACDALVAGFDGEHLVELAATSVNASERDADADRVIHAALEEQHRPLPPRHSAEAEEAALHDVVVEALNGRWVPRELAAWAHRVIGHGGIALAQPLVELDDAFDCIDYAGQSVEDLDESVLAFCRTVANL